MNKHTKILPELVFAENLGLQSDSFRNLENETDFFNLYFCDEIKNIIVKETNLFEKHMFEEKITKEPSSSSTLF